MRELAQKLMSLQIRPASESAQLPTAIFGSAELMTRYLELNRPRLRVGVCPLRSEAAPEVAMGIAAVLAYLLENWEDVRVYRLFARLESPHSADSVWTMAQSQFTIDDWQMEGLDENAALWGTLAREGNSWMLRLEVESDQLEQEAPQVFTRSAGSIAEIVSALPELAAQVAAYLDAGSERPYAVRYDAVKTSDERITVLLKQLFQWELKLLLALWGTPWTPDEIRAAHKDALDSAREAGGAFGAWAASHVLGRALLPGFMPVGETLVPAVVDVLTAFGETLLPGMVLAPSLYALGYTKEAYELLEDVVEDYPDEARYWLLLADMYWQGRRMGDSLATFQRAIDYGILDLRLFMRYAELLTVLNYENWILEDFMLMNPEEVFEDRIRWEAVAAYDEALEIDPTNAEALHQQLLLLIDLEDAPDIEDLFERLSKADVNGERIREVVDAMYDLPDLQRYERILRAALERQPERYDLHLSLTSLLLLDEREDEARAELDKVDAMTDDADVEADVNRLRLSANDPDFEQRLGELNDIVSAGNTLHIEDVEYLEDAVAQAPTFAELYLLLARAYLRWEEPSTALETLLDGQKNLPNHPDILELLVRVLWAAKQQDLALDYLRKGVEVNPDHVPLLALYGRLLFETDKDNESRFYLMRAEAIAPHHPAVVEARVRIAQSLGGTGS